MSTISGWKSKTKMTECFWCNEVFDSVDHDSCPSCARDTHTKEITIIREGNDDSEEDL
jgi:rRNA maturation endonuclease Nob1